MEENFLPWSMIEPLVEECDMCSDLVLAVMRKLGLPRGKYKLVTPNGTGHLTPVEAIKHGVYVMPLNSKKHRDVTDEPVR